MKYSDKDLSERILEHRGHVLNSVIYGTETRIRNVAIECETCGCVVIDYDLDESGKPVVEKRFAAFWGQDIYETNMEVIHSVDWFTEELGYEGEDVEKLRNLSVGQWETLSLGHTVMRVD